MNVTTGKRGMRSLVSVGVYGVLFLLGLVEGIIGSFQYSLTAGRVPVAALVCCAVILATCLLGAWAMRSVSAAILPGMGWIIASFVLSMPVSNGSVIITNTTPGKWYLYGGTLSVAAGVIASFAAMARWTGRPGQPGQTGVAGRPGTPGATGTPPSRAGDR
jgi:ABC-type transport system involved in multi-copper enzyme maturation permease subunit